jgi:ribosome-binding ATPase YchF (GTP1/OBG family)
VRCGQTRVNVPDERFDWLVQNFLPKSEVQPYDTHTPLHARAHKRARARARTRRYLEIVDIAGLVKGAAQVRMM